MTEAEIIGLFENAGFMPYPNNVTDDGLILGFSLGKHNTHVFRHFPKNTYLHINNNHSYQRFDLGKFPEIEINVIDLIDKIKAIIKLYGE